MKTAKYLLSLFFLFLASQYTYAQSNYKQGYVITNENDTLIGWIDYRTDRMNSKICRFKKDETRDRYYYIFEDTDGKMTYLTKRPDETIAGDDRKIIESHRTGRIRPGCQIGYRF